MKWFPSLVLSSVPKCEKAVLCLLEKTRVSDWLSSGMSSGAAGHEFNVQIQQYMLNRKKGNLIFLSTAAAQKAGQLLISWSRLKGLGALCQAHGRGSRGTRDHPHFKTHVHSGPNNLRCLRCPGPSLFLQKLPRSGSFFYQWPVQYLLVCQFLPCPLSQRNKSCLINLNESGTCRGQREGKHQNPGKKTPSC